MLTQHSEVQTSRSFAVCQILHVLACPLLSTTSVETRTTYPPLLAPCSYMFQDHFTFAPSLVHTIFLTIVLAGSCTADGVASNYDSTYNTFFSKRRILPSPIPPITRRLYNPAPINRTDCNVFIPQFSTAMTTSTPNPPLKGIHYL